MKKVLIGLAAAAMAVAGIGGSASAAPSDSIYDQITAWGGTNLPGPYDGSGALNGLILAVGGFGSGKALDKCDAGSPMYTVFWPADDTIFLGAALALNDEDPLDFSLYGILGGDGTAESYLNELLADSATINGLLKLHVVNGQFTDAQLESGSYTTLPSLGGLPITIDGDGSSFTVNDNAAVYSETLACNGAVHFIAGLIAPPAAPGAPACGANYAGQCPAGTSGSGSGLPKTGSESMALTYAALASLIAGAGALVIRRRSIA